MGHPLVITIFILGWGKFVVRGGGLQWLIIGWYLEQWYFVPSATQHLTVEATKMATYASQIRWPRQRFLDLSCNIYLIANSNNDNKFKL
jgi:hypothetical protein